MRLDLAPGKTVIQGTGAGLGRPRRRVNRRAWLVAAALVLALLALAAWVAITVRRDLLLVAAESNRGRAELIAGADTVKSGGLGLSAGDAATAVADFQGSEQDFQSAHRRLTSSRLLRLIGILPLADRQMTAAIQLTDMGVRASQLGQLGVKAITSATKQKGPAEPGEKLLSILASIDPKLGAIRQLVDEIAADRQRIPSGLLPPLSHAVSQLDSKVNVRSISSVVSELPADEAGLRALLGAAGPKTYLVLNQDPAELRATGGFTDSVRVPVVSPRVDGPISARRMWTSIDRNAQGAFVLGPPGTPGHVDLPYPMATTFKIPSWQLRDSNWSPDFPTAAQKAEFFLNREVGRQVDGVIAIDPHFIERFLALIGPVKIPESGDIVDQNNFFAVTLNVREVSSSGRSTILPNASKIILERV